MKKLRHCHVPVYTMPIDFPCRCSLAEIARGTSSQEFGEWGDANANRPARFCRVSISQAPHCWYMTMRGEAMHKNIATNSPKHAISSEKLHFCGRGLTSSPDPSHVDPSPSSSPTKPSVSAFAFPRIPARCTPLLGSYAPTSDVRS